MTTGKSPLQRLVQAYLDTNGVSMREMSKKLGDNPGLVKDIMSGRVAKPRRKTLVALSSVLGVPVDQLVEGEAPAATGLPAGQVEAVRWIPRGGYVDEKPYGRLVAIEGRKIPLPVDDSSASLVWLSGYEFLPRDLVYGRDVLIVDTMFRMNPQIGIEFRHLLYAGNGKFMTGFYAGPKAPKSKDEEIIEPGIKSPARVLGKVDRVIKFQF